VLGIEVVGSKRQRFVKAAKVRGKKWIFLFLKGSIISLSMGHGEHWHQHGV